MIRRLVSVVIIIVATVLGGAMGALWYALFGQPWSSVGARSADIVDMEACQADFWGALYVVLARTDDGRLLSTGPQRGFVKQWQWTDISGGHAWSDFPEVTSNSSGAGSYDLHIRYEGNVYRVDASGRWQPFEVQDGEFSLRSYTRENISTSELISLRWFPGEVTKVQKVGITREWFASGYSFALVRAKGVWYRVSGGTGWLNSLLCSLLGAIVGFVVGRRAAAAGLRRTSAS